MNQAGIQDGDRVLLKCPRNVSIVPETGDIVAAVIRGTDRKATLKRFAREGGYVTLKPQSTNSAHEARAFTASRWDKEVEVAGIVVAVLKRKG